MATGRDCKQQDGRGDCCGDRPQPTTASRSKVTSIKASDSGKSRPGTDRASNKSRPDSNHAHKTDVSMTNDRGNSNPVSKEASHAGSSNHVYPQIPNSDFLKSG